MRQNETQEKLIKTNLLIKIKIKQISNYSSSKFNNKSKRSKLITMESALASNGNLVDLTMDESQVLVKTRAKVGRLQKSLRNLKGQLTKEVNMCLQKITHFKTKYSDDYLANSVIKLITPRAF